MKRARFLLLAAVAASASVAASGAEPAGDPSLARRYRDKAQEIRQLVQERLWDEGAQLYKEAECVHDPIKTFNVYVYGMCCRASSNIEALARYVGLDARGWFRWDSGIS